MGEIADALKRAGVAASKAMPTRERTEQPERDTSYAEVLERAGDADRNGLAPHASDEPDVIIPTDREGDWISRAVVVQGDGATPEAYRHCALRLSRELGPRGLRSLAVVSALRGDGKTTTACNVALAFATMSAGRRVALVDLDLRKPSIGGIFRARPEVGIDDVLRGTATIGDVRLRTNYDSLDLFPSVAAMRAPHEQLPGPELSQLLAALERAYDIVIVDTAPMLLVPDAGIVLPQLGGCMVVMRSGETRRDAFERMIEQLPPGKLIGAFLNDVRGLGRGPNYGRYGPAASGDT